MVKNKGHDNIKGKGFDAHPENINKTGVNKKQINKLAAMTQRDYGIKLTKADIYQMIQHCLEMDLKALTKIVQERTDPVFMLCIATAIMHDMKKGNISTVESIFDRIFGRPTQSHEVSGPAGAPLTFAQWMQNGKDTGNTNTG